MTRRRTQGASLVALRIDNGRPVWNESLIGARADIRAFGIIIDDDTNVDGVYEGYFLYPMHMTLPWPDWDWDPAVNLKGLEMVQRLGYVAVFKGRRQDPQGRAVDVYQKILEHLYKRGGGRDEVVAARLEEAPHLEISQRFGISTRMVEKEIKAALGFCAAKLERKVFQRFGRGAGKPSSE